MGIKDTAKENPIVVTVSSLVALAIAGTALWQGVQLTDQLIMTHAEADIVHAQFVQQHADFDERMLHENKLNECRYLSDKIDRLEYEIYVLERDQASPDLVQSRRQNLSRIQRRFNALQCARLL
jgi:hypothetical protein